MNHVFVFLFMIFLHIFDDFFLQCQGALNTMKQRNWWKVNCTDEQYKKYKNDYIIVLLLHAFSWSFSIMLPLAFLVNFNVDTIFFVLFIGNTIIHALIDHLKCNNEGINLIQDQVLHLLQILATFCVITSRI